MDNKKTEKKPNILLFLTDQHSLDAIGCYGAKICKTPNIDALAEQGTRFDNNYTACPLCSPARATIFSGREVHVHGVTTNVHEIGCNVSEIADSPNNLSRKLLDAGYSCGYTGKWHIGDGCNSSLGKQTVDPATPLTRGFEGQCTPENKGGWMFDDFKEYLKTFGLENEIPNYEKSFRSPSGEQLVVEHPIEGTCEYFLAENTIKLIDDFSKRDKPFFIWHNTWGPHGAYICHSSFYNLYKDVNIEEPKNFKVEKSALTLPSKFKRMHDNKPWTYFEQDLRLYYALTTQIDAMLGRIVEHLKSENLFDNTVIIFTSDHGTHCGKHGGLIDKGFSHYEEALRTGCVIFDPRDRVKRVINNYTGLIDIYPTILDYAGAEIPKESDGHSLRALMVEEKNSWKDHAFIEFYGLGNVVTTMLTVVYNGMKYGWNATNSDELYDLINDPLETKNLIDKEEYKTKLQKLREKLYIHLKEHNNVLQYIFKIFVLQHNYPEIWGDVPH